MEGITAKVESYYRSLLGSSQPGDRLPSERSVMSDLQTCRSTVRLVLTKLEAEGAVERIHGKGTYKPADLEQGQRR